MTPDVEQPRLLALLRKESHHIGFARPFVCLDPRDVNRLLDVIEAAITLSEGLQPLVASGGTQLVRVPHVQKLRQALAAIGEWPRTSVEPK